MDELRYYSRPVSGNREARLSTANRPERSIYGKPDYAQDPAMVIQACHRTLSAFGRENKGKPKSATLSVAGMEPERIAKLVAAVSAIRGMSARHKDEYPHVSWKDIITSLGVGSQGGTQTQIKEFYQKVMSPAEYEGCFGETRRFNAYVFDAPFTMAIGKELEQYGFSLKEAAAALQCELTPQGHQWRLAQLKPYREAEAEKHAQTQAQTADNISQMTKLLLQRRKTAPQANER